MELRARTKYQGDIFPLYLILKGYAIEVMAIHYGNGDGQGCWIDVQGTKKEIQRIINNHGQEGT